ncbi:MAG TPA: SufD family Fe-S cluster assembly protein [Thermoleophilaceae bacterium]|nr:SufD family Fe-S cluster assembly protein [Thermoleophilaceae bacterium]
MPPEFVEKRRAAALEVYEREPVPTWRRSGFWTTTLRHLNLEELEPKHYEPIAERPEIVANDELAALIVQKGASVVYSEVNDDRITLTSLEEAAEQRPELVEQWWGKRVNFEEGKFPAATGAFWTGGAFLHVPRGVKIEKPIQIVWLIDEPGTAQYAQTLAVVDEMAECEIREYFLAPDFEGQALHSGLFELFVRPAANVRLAHFQDWGAGEVYDISTRRVEIARDAHCSWVPIHLGGRLTKQTLDIITAEQGSDMRHTGLYITQGDEHLDLFTTDLHEAGNTTGDTVWKGALTGESRASYEGLIHIVKDAQDTDTYLQTHSMLLSPRAKGDAIPSLIVETDNVKASHGGTVGEIDEDQVFYMQSRGIPRPAAVRILVEGYFEEVIQRLHDPVLEEMVRERIAQKIAEAEEDVREYVAQR